MRGLVIAEKPSFMKSIQKAYKSDKYPYELDFLHLHGHVMRLSTPDEYNPAWRNWSLNSLPIIPGKFIYVPADTKTVNAVVQAVKSGKYDFVVNACDAEREGELIFWSLYDSYNLTTEVKRFWCSTTQIPTLREELHNLRPASEFDNLKRSAYLRAYFDWLVGINFSRAVGLKTKKFKGAGVGRIMSPTLKFVVDRELEIQNFVQTEFFEVNSLMEKDGLEFTAAVCVPPENKGYRFTSKQDAENVLKAMSDSATVQTVTQEDKSTIAPTLYSTTNMQGDADKYFGWKASKTDAIAQELYEAGYLSYPRTECRFISTDMVPEFENMLKPLQNFPELQTALKLVTPESIKRVGADKTYVNDAELTDHTAITTTTAVFDPSVLSPDQLKLYLMVARRFLAIFLPPYVVSSTSVTLSSNSAIMRVSGRTLKDKGFSILYNDKSKDTILPDLKKGDIVAIKKPSVHKGITKPPARYRTATLTNAMANAGKFVTAAEQRLMLKEKGIGTGATRASTLDKLEKTKMMTMEKGYYIPTEYGMALIQAIGDRNVCSPSMTAEWESRLQNVSSASDASKLYADMTAYITEETNDIVSKLNVDLSRFDDDVVGKCPLCGGSVKTTNSYYLCQNYKAEQNPCTFVVSRLETKGTKITEEDIRLLLSGKPTKEKNLTLQSGQKYSAALILREDGKVGLAGSTGTQSSQSVSKKDLSLIKGIHACPCCKDGRIYKSKNYYLCTNKGDDCNFVLPLTLHGTPVSEEDAICLIEGKKLPPRMYTWKSGKSSKAVISGIPTEKNGANSFELKYEFEN